jgi:hypothetical protein
LFVGWSALFSFIESVTPQEMVGSSFWAIKTQQVVLGVGFGIICAFIFTLLQNTINSSHREWLSIFLAIATWLCIKLLIAFAMGEFLVTY